MFLERILSAKDVIKRKFPDEFCPIGYENKMLLWEIVIDEDGNFISPIINLGDTRSKKISERGQMRPLPWDKRSNQISPRIIADNAGYVLGISKSESENDTSRIKKAHQAYIDLVKKCYDETGSDDVLAVLKFLEKDKGKALAEAIVSKIESADTISFRIEGRKEAVIYSPDVISFWEDSSEDLEDEGECLLCGKFGKICKIHPIKIIGVPGTNKNSGDLVSFNNSSTWSYNMKQSLNAPTCSVCARDYCRIINAILRDKNHSIKFKNNVIMVWGEEKDEDPRIINLNSPQISDVKNMIMSPMRGKPIAGEDDEMFNVANLMSGGSRVARIAIRKYQRQYLYVIRERVARYFDLSRIEDQSKDQCEEKFYSISYLILAACKTDPENKDFPDKIIKNTFGENFMAEFFSAIVMGEKIPAQRLLYALIGRVSAGDKFSSNKASLARFLLNQKKEMFTMSLDKNLRDQAYLLGRFFSLIEFMQEDKGKTNCPLAKRYLNEMMSHPRRAFVKLSELKVKYENQRNFNKVFYDKAVGEITDELTVDNLPNTFNISQKAAFLLGRYHQTSDVWKQRIAKKDEKNQNGEDPQEEK